MPGTPAQCGSAQLSSTPARPGAHQPHRIGHQRRGVRVAGQRVLLLDRTGTPTPASERCEAQLGRAVAKVDVQHGHAACGTGGGAVGVLLLL